MLNKFKSISYPIFLNDFAILLKFTIILILLIKKWNIGLFLLQLVSLDFSWTEISEINFKGTFFQLMQK